MRLALKNILMLKAKKELMRWPYK